MSAIPKKKLCWNCEGNVSRQIDNCPYCGVYLHAEELEEEGFWHPSRQSSKYQELEQEQEQDPTPSPLYQITPEVEETTATHPKIEELELKAHLVSFEQLKQDVFPTLFLMSGSVFFLFGVILLLFSQEGSLTLQWNGNHWIYFLALGIPFLCYGWKCLQQIHLDKR